MPPLGRLPLLKLIHIERMSRVKRMGDEFYGSTSDLLVFPSLQKLRIWDMPNLEEWSSPSSSSANENSTQAFFPCLQDLTIWVCPKLKAFPLVPCLQDLELKGCYDAILGSAINLNSLRSLKICVIIGLKSLPAELQNLTSLQRLHVSYCTKVLFSIKDFQSLNSLQSLTLSILPQLTTLPEGIRHLTMLRSLDIWSCNNMRMLSEELKQLTTLQSLKIEDCHPYLHKRCVKDKGDDWHIISHIPNLAIGSPKSEEESVPSTRCSVMHKLRNTCLSCSNNIE